MLRWVLLLAILAALLAAARHFHLPDLFRAFLSEISGLGWRGWALFVALYVLACVLFLPGSILTLGAGAVFGVGRGFALVSLASTLGAACSFLIGRTLARGWVAGKIEGNPKFRAMDEAVAREGWKIVGLARLSPLFPFNLLNYALGVTRVSFRDYALASWIGMMPGTALYVYLGSLAGSLADLGRGGRSRTPAEWAFYGAGLVATGAVAFYVTRIARRALQRRIP